MEKLLMVKVEVKDREIREKGILRVCPKDMADGEGFFTLPSRLIDPGDLVIGLPKKGEQYWSFNSDKWTNARSDHYADQRHQLIHRKLKDKRQEWKNRCPMFNAIPGAREELIAWIEERFEIAKNDPLD